MARDANGRPPGHPGLDPFGRVVYKQASHPRYVANLLQNHRGSFLLWEKKV